MNHDRFVYVTYIRTTTDKLWEALTSPDFNRKYWFGMWQETDWSAGSSWKLTFPDGRIADAGEILEVDRPKRIVLRWRHQLRPELHAEGDSRATFELEQLNDLVKLTVVHEIDRQDSRFIEAVSGGWPMILSSLKSLLETGVAHQRTGTPPKAQ
jgi:uncharacterized protein YndB with AHSA1/START domain